MEAQQFVAVRRSRDSRVCPCLAVYSLLYFAVWVGLAKGQTAHLQFAETPALLDCHLPSSRPCFRINLNIVDDSGRPVQLELPAGHKLPQAISVLVNGEVIAPFYAAPPGAEVATERQRRIALILLDDSGSMNKPIGKEQTRFQAAKAAASQFLGNFENGVDRVAIVPFESHHVVETIQQAVFANSVETARHEIDVLPSPRSQNNTGLYSAIDTGLDVLKLQSRNTGVTVDTMLIVLTDGKNDVGHPNDDPGLLGDLALDELQKKVAGTPGVQVVAVGFGNASGGEVDEEALKTITPHYYRASDAESLSQVFKTARALQTSSIQVTFESAAPDRASLAGKSLSLQVLLRLPNGGSVASDVRSWSAPSMGIVSYDGNCGPEEQKALVDALFNASRPEQSPWSLLRPVLVFVGLGAVLLALWLWVPCLIWTPQYTGEFQTGRPRGRWAGTAAEPDSPSSPEGPSQPGTAEEGTDVSRPHRTPADATRVLPANLTSTRTGARTRLDTKWTSEDGH